MRTSIFKMMIKNGHIAPIKAAYEKNILTDKQRAYVKEILIHVGEIKRKSSVFILQIVIGLMFIVFLTLVVGCEKVIERIEVQNEPCSVEQNSLGALITCPNKPAVQIYNGTNGVDGQDYDPTILNALYVLLQQLEDRVGNLEDAPETQFVKLCPNSTEYTIKQGPDLYAVGFTPENGGGLVLLTPNTQYLTTTNLTNACKFTVNANGTTSNYSYGHNIASQFQQQQPTAPVVPAIQAQFKIEKYNNGQIVETWYVRNVGQINYAILDSGGNMTQSHGFVVNDNANNLGKAQCNIQNLQSVNTTQVFENCQVTKL